MCEGHDYCESEETIRAWLKRKFVLLIFNEIKFELDGFGQDVSIYESKLLYMPVNSQMREIIPFSVKKTSLSLQDNMSLMLGDLTMKTRDDLFEVKRLTSLPYEFVDNVWLSITVEMDFDITTYEREVYTCLELLSDIGGLSGMLMTVFGFLIMTWNYQVLDNFLVSKLFKIRKPEEQLDENENYFNQSYFITLSSFPYCGELLRNLCPRCKRCCRQSRKFKAMQIAREQMMSEINIITIVKTQRYIKAALKFLLSAHKRLKLKEHKRYIQINPEQTGDLKLKTSRQTFTDRNEIEKNQQFFTDGFFSSESSNDQIELSQVDASDANQQLQDDKVLVNDQRPSSRSEILTNKEDAVARERVDKLHDQSSFDKLPEQISVKPSSFNPASDSVTLCSKL